MATFAMAVEPNEDAKHTGSCEVTVIYTGKVPKFRLADNSGVPDDRLVVDRRSKGLQYAVVWLDPVKPAGAVIDAEQAFKAGGKLKSVTIDQVDERFVPRLIAVRSGQPVKFANSDQGNHNVRSASMVEANQFNKFTPRAGSSFTHRFRSDRKNRPTIIGCDIHAWMHAVIYAFDHDRFAVTGEKGKAIVARLSPGAYRLHVRQPDAGLHRNVEVTIAAGKATNVEVKFLENEVKP